MTVLRRAFTVPLMTILMVSVFGLGATAAGGRSYNGTPYPVESTSAHGRFADGLCGHRTAHTVKAFAGQP